MKIFKYEESKLVKIRERDSSSKTDNNGIKNKDTLDTEVPMGEDKVEESKEYSFLELKDFLESL